MNMHANPSTKTEYDEQQFENIEKMRTQIGMKKQVSLKSKTAVAQSTVI